MHLRMPSIDKGVQSFLWAVVFVLYLFFGMKAIGVEGAVALVVSLVAGFLIFLLVRTRGSDERSV
jgi:purine-cytosine permease-like protein